MATSLPVISSPLDSRDYRVRVLQNGSRGLLISELKTRDPAAVMGINRLRRQLEAFDRAYFAQPITNGAPAPPLYVPHDPSSFQYVRGPSKAKIAEAKWRIIITVRNAGHLSSGAMPGKAHMAEHEAFFASFLYPDGEGLERFLEDNGGFWTAETLPTRTIFEIHAPGKIIGETVRRVVDCFARLTLTAEDVTHEARAVDNEFWLKMVQEAAPFIELLAELANEGHPFKTSWWGDLSSLQPSADLLQNVLEFWRTYYHAENLDFVIIADVPMPQLEAVADMFESVPAPSIPAPVFNWNSPLDQANFNRVIIVNPSVVKRQVQLTWYIHGPHSVRDFRKSKALDFVAYMAMSDRRGSLSDHLRQRGWLENMCFNQDKLGKFSNNPNENFLLVSLHLYLTEEGMRNWKIIVPLTLQYFQQLGALQERLRPYYEEYKSFRLMAFHYFRDEHFDVDHGSASNITPAQLRTLETPLLKFLAQYLEEEKDDDPGQILLDSLTVREWNDTVPYLLTQLGQRNLLNILVQEENRYTGGGVFQRRSAATERADWEALWENQGLRDHIFPLSAHPNPYAFTGHCTGMLRHYDDAVVMQPSTRVRVAYTPQNISGIMGTGMAKLRVVSEVAQLRDTSTVSRLLLLSKCWQRLLRRQLADALATNFTLTEDANCPYMTVALYGPSSHFLRALQEVVATFRDIEELLTEDFFQSCRDEVISDSLFNEHITEPPIFLKLLHEALDRHVCSGQDIRRDLAPATFTLQHLIAFLRQVKSAMRLELEVEGSIPLPDVTALRGTLLAIPFGRRRNTRLTIDPALNQRGIIPVAGLGRGGNRNAGVVGRDPFVMARGAPASAPATWIIETQALSRLTGNHMSAHYYEFGLLGDLPAGLGAMFSHMGREFYRWFRCLHQYGYDPELTFLEQEEGNHGVFGLLLTGSLLGYRGSTEVLDQALLTFVTEYHRLHIRNTYPAELRKKRVSQVRMRRFFDDFLLAGNGMGGRRKLLILRVAGHTAAVPGPPRNRQVQTQVASFPINIGGPIVTRTEFRQRLEYYPEQ